MKPGTGIVSFHVISFHSFIHGVSFMSCHFELYIFNSFISFQVTKNLSKLFPIVTSYFRYFRPVRAGMCQVLPGVIVYEWW